MRALFRNCDNDTVFAAEIAFATCKPNCGSSKYSELLFEATNGKVIQLVGIHNADAEDFIGQLFANGKMDFSEYSAFVRENNNYEV